MKKKIFDAALASNSNGLQRGQLTHGLYDRLVFNKIKQALGMDCIRIMISGSAPLSENVMVFFRCMLGVPVVEGTNIASCGYFFLLPVFLTRHIYVML